jgi:Ni,Fe-hydrogenase III large subunit
MDDDLTLLREFVVEIKEEVEHLNRRLDQLPQMQKTSSNVHPIASRKILKSYRTGYMTSTTSRL